MYRFHLHLRRPRLVSAQGRTRSARQPVATRPQVEELETRLAPSVDLLGNPAVPSATPSIHVLTSRSTAQVGSMSLPAGFSPGQISQAYGFNQITFNNGTIRGDGSGQTIAIVDAYSQPNIVSDLQTFDSTYGLSAPPSFTVVNQSGGASLPVADSNWGLEESLDVEWAHAMAPGANLVLVEANSSGWSDLFSAVNYARNLSGVSVVSMSWGGGEWSGENLDDSYFTTPSGHAGVTFVAATGDSGSAGAPNYPSASANVLAVGGTQLSTDSSGNYLGETGWGGSGGGISLDEAQPSYQNGVVTQSSTMRTVPDVAYNASSGSPYAIYDSPYGGWAQVYGTSAAAPQWAALVAIADQGRSAAGEGTLDGATQTLPMLYQLPGSDFHDITSGSNGAYSAGPGYDLVTGRGSPVANLIVAGLVSSTVNPPPTNQGPWVVTPASATPSPVAGTTTNLSVLGNDSSGASGLIYTWSVLSEPSGSAVPTFSANGTNAAQNITATFQAAGTYTFQATITDGSGLSIVSDVTVTVNQTLTNVALTPGSASVADGGTQQFTATANDQFGHAMSTQPSFTWSLAGGIGTLGSNGLFAAPSTGSGTATIQATGGGMTGSASVTVSSVPAAPSNLIVTGVSAHQVNLAWTDNSSNETGFYIQRSTNGSNWSQIGQVGANVTTFADTSVSKHHTYYYRVYAYNSFGNSAYSNTTSGVNPNVKVVAATGSSTGAPALNGGGFVVLGDRGSGRPGSSSSFLNGDESTIVTLAMTRLTAETAPPSGSSTPNEFWSAWGEELTQGRLAQQLSLSQMFWQAWGYKPAREVFGDWIL